MSQNYSDDVFGSTQQVQTNMQQIEDNFACLKSSFSGAAAPPDPVAGMWWFDTDANILKLRNEDNNAWLSIWDLANNKPVVTNLSAEITLAMMAASAASAAAATPSLRKIGTGATDACAGNDARLSDERAPTNGSVTEAKLAASAVSQAKLKTTTGEVSVNVPSSSTASTSALPGGEYGFMFRLKAEAGYTAFVTWAGFVGTLGSSYALPALKFSNSDGNAHYGYAEQRYVTSSGEDVWLFVLLTSNGTVKRFSLSDEHPCFGRGGDPDKVPHPFVGAMEAGDEVVRVIIDKADLEAMLTAGKSPLQSVIEDCEIDYSDPPEWPEKEVTVGLPDGYTWQYCLNHLGEEVAPIKKVIKKPEGVRTARLRKK